MKYVLLTYETHWGDKPDAPMYKCTIQCTFLCVAEGNKMKPVAEKTTIWNGSPVQNPVWSRPLSMEVLHKDIYTPMGNNELQEISKAEAVAIMLIADRRKNT